MSLRKKILAFDEGMTVYSHLEKDEEDITISFAQSLYITATKICELLPEYLEDLAHGECKEALGIDYDKMTSMAYWMKNGKLKADMMALKDVTLKERGIEFAYKGFKAKTTWELYEAIEQKVAGMVEMLKEVKQRIKAAPPSLYGNFFRYQKSLCDRRSVEARYARWKRDIGVPNIELLKDKEAQEVVDFLKKKVFQHIKEPSTREVGLVDLNSLSEHMPEGNTFPDEFPHCYTRFLRYAKVEDGIYHINYNAYGQYLFDFYYLLTPDERQAFIELDIMLDLIHQDMASISLSGEMDSVENRIRHCIELLMKEQYDGEPLFNQQNHWQAVYRILVDKEYCHDSDFEGFDAFILKVMPDKVNKPYKKDSVKHISQTSFVLPFDRWKYDSTISGKRKPYDRMVLIASRFKDILERNGL